MTPRFTAIILARKGSKRLPGKNTKSFFGKPLILWTIEAAIQSKHVNSIIVTSDDEKVLALKAIYKEINFINRPAELASDTASSQDVVVHALKDREHEYAVLLQPTSPLRNSKDIDDAIEAMLLSKASSCISVTELPKPSSFYLGLKNEKYINLSNYEKLYRTNGAIYAFNVKSFYELKRFDSENTLRYVMPHIRSCDIDNEEDFILAEMTMEFIENASRKK